MVNRTKSPADPSVSLTRRSLLRVGGLGLMGLSLPGSLHAAQSERGHSGRARAVIFLHQFGGPSQIDTFDMKPEAPEQVRGEFRAVQTRVPGIRMCERLPGMARVADKIALVRGLHHTMKNHNSAAYYSLTGHAPPVDDIRLKDTADLFPAHGSVVARLAPAAKDMPTFVAFPHVLRDGSVTPGQHASFLGKAHNPLVLTHDPNGRDFQFPELSLPADLPIERMEDRLQVLRLIDQQSRLFEGSAKAGGFDGVYDRALGLLTSPRMKKAFDLSAEPAGLRDRYGRTTYGQSCLLARRLVEAGARFINVYFAATIGGQGSTGGWDTHGFGQKPMYPILKNYLLPITDQAVPALLEDLDARGLLDETLVVWVGEFGRSPKINAMAGRDHWPQCYTALLAGGGTRRGFIHGASDRSGAYPATDPVRPDDLAATILYLLGIGPDREIFTPLNQPVRVTEGKPILALLA